MDRLAVPRGRENPPPVPAPTPAGQVYLDVTRRRLHCLNDRARQLLQQGVPFTPADLERFQLEKLDGSPVRAADLPLVVSWRETRAVDATFVLRRPGPEVQHVCWSTAPLLDDKGHVAAVVGSVQCRNPEPDWHVLAGLSHDLRTPLQTLKVLLSYLEQQPSSDARLTALLEHVRSSTDRALLIGRDLVEWCRAPLRGGRPYEPTWFLLEPLLRQLASEQTMAARQKGLTLIPRLDAARPWEVHADAVRLGRVLANLLANAVRYTQAGVIEFTASWQREPPAETLVLSVIDSGVGITPEEQESIFQPFERGRAAKEGDTSGSGVGLSVVDRLVEEMGLQLEVYSEYGRGSAFHLHVPKTVLRRHVVSGDQETLDGL